MLLEPQVQAQLVPVALREERTMVQALELAPSKSERVPIESQLPSSIEDVQVQS